MPRRYHKPRGETYKKYVPPAFQPKEVDAGVPRRDEGAFYPSADTGGHMTLKVSSPRYTGTLVRGIATMHKSNAVPVIDSEHIKDISRMRRS